MQLTEQGSEHHHPDGSQPSPAAFDYKPVPFIASSSVIS